VREKKKGKIIHKKEFPETVGADRIVVCHQRAAGLNCGVVKLASRLQLDHTTRHKSCHLLLLVCMYVDDQSAPNRNAFSLCEKRKKEK
jgi:hypothetical protein